MHRLLFLTLFLLILNGCSKNASPDPVTLVTIHVSENWFRTTDDYKSTGYAIISDLNGDLISFKNLPNNETVIFEGEFDLDNEQYNLTFLTFVETLTDEFEEPDFFYSLKTYLDISPLDVELEYYHDPHEIAYVSFENIPDFNLINFKGSFQGGYYDFSIDNASIRLNVPVIFAPGDLFIHWQKNGSTNHKYVWVEDMDEGDEVTFNYEDVPIVEDSIQVSFPDNVNAYQSIFGSKGGGKPFFNIGQSTSWTQNSISVLFPDDIFEEYMVRTRMKNDNGIYLSEKTMNEVASEYQLPLLDFEVNNTSIGNFQIVSNHYYDFFKVLSGNEYDINRNQLDWTISGVGAENINFNLSQIIENLLGDHGFSNDLVIPFRTEVVKYQTALPYSKFINDSFKGTYGYNKITANPYEKFYKDH